MVNQHKLGLLFGAFMGALHVEWVGLVLIGWAKPLLDWVFRLHFIDASVTILPFSIGSAIALVIATSVVSYASGWILGFIWNGLHGQFPAISSIASARQSGGLMEH